jgi:hypothetical protein
MSVVIAGEESTTPGLLVPLQGEKVGMRGVIRGHGVRGGAPSPRPAFALRATAGQALPPMSAEASAKADEGGVGARALCRGALRTATSRAACAPACALGASAGMSSAPLVRCSSQSEGGSVGAGRGEGVYPRVALPIVEAPPHPDPPSPDGFGGAGPPSPDGFGGQGPPSALGFGTWDERRCRLLDLLPPPLGGRVGEGGSGGATDVVPRRPPPPTPPHKGEGSAGTVPP